MLELTISGVHFGPMAPDPGAFVDLVTQRDGGGKPTMSSFRLSGSGWPNSIRGAPSVVWTINPAVLL